MDLQQSHTKPIDITTPFGTSTPVNLRLTSDPTNSTASVGLGLNCTSNFTMSSFSQYPLPVLTGLLGALGAGSLSRWTGTAGFANVYGIPIPSGSDSSVSPKSKSLAAWQDAFLRVHMIRNASSGLSLLGLTLFWKFSSLCRTSPVAEEAVRKCLGVVLAVGSLVTLGDGFIIRQYLNRVEGTKGEVSSQDLEVSRSKWKGHTFMTVPILGLALTYLLT